MITLKVADMHCEKCVERITNALNKADISFDIRLKDKTVKVDESKVDKAIEELDDLGFSAEKQ